MSRLLRQKAWAQVINALFVGIGLGGMIFFAIMGDGMQVLAGAGVVVLGGVLAYFTHRGKLLAGGSLRKRPVARGSVITSAILAGWAIPLCLWMVATDPVDNFWIITLALAMVAMAGDYMVAYREQQGEKPVNPTAGIPERGTA